MTSVIPLFSLYMKTLKRNICIQQLSDPKVIRWYNVGKNGASYTGLMNFNNIELWVIFFKIKMNVNLCKKEWYIYSTVFKKRQIKKKVQMSLAILPVYNHLWITGTIDSSCICILGIHICIQLLLPLYIPLDYPFSVL